MDDEHPSRQSHHNSHEDKMFTVTLSNQHAKLRSLSTSYIIYYLPTVHHQSIAMPADHGASVLHCHQLAVAVGRRHRAIALHASY
jgi:hypothetical protein